MDSSPVFLAALHTHRYPGRRGVGSRWNAVDSLLGEALRSQGAEVVEICEGRLLATFSALGPAVCGVAEALVTARSGLDWAPGLGPLPCQAALHARGRAEADPPAFDPGSGFWKTLPFESLHVSDPLRRHWRRLAAGSDLAGSSFAPGPLGFHRLEAPGAAPGRDLFPARALPYLWGNEECFYCGHTAHGPSACPSSLLTADVHGLSAVGRLRVPDLVEAYRRLVGSPEELGRRLSEVSHQAQLRKDPALAGAAAFFDIQRVWQPRFLLRLAFADGGGWPGIGVVGRGRVPTGNSLYLALDSLRVGRRAEARAMLSDKRRRGPADRFYVQIGLGFLAVAEGGTREAAATWAEALKTAANREERIYVNLLLSRAWELLGDLERAAVAAERVLAVRGDCAEGHYRAAQLQVRAGDGARALPRIRTLALADPDYFALALLDPALAPVGAAVDALLAEALEVAAKRAAGALERAGAECAQLAGWLDAGDPSLEANQGTLGRLREQASRQAYVDLLEAADRAQGLVASCTQTRRKRLQSLQAEVRQRRARWEVFHSAWKSYPHKVLFREYGTLLAASRRDLDEASSLAVAEDVDSYRGAVSRLESAGKVLESLRTTLRDMAWTRSAIAFFRSLTVRLAVYEVLLVPLALFGIPLLARVLGGEAGSALAGSTVQHRTAALLGGLVAPLLALGRAVSQVRSPGAKAGGTTG